MHSVMEYFHSTDIIDINKLNIICYIRNEEFQMFTTFAFNVI